MRITKGEVRHVARLARLELNEEQEELFALQLNSILNYMEMLKELDTEGVEPSSHATHIYNAFREDEVQPSLPKEASLDNAPEKTEDFFVVPRVI